MKSFIKFMELAWNPSKFGGTVSRKSTVSEFFFNYVMPMVLRDLKDSKRKFTGITY